MNKVKELNVLSLCDGMSCGQIALKELNIPINNYYASEIDKNSIKVTMDNFPDTIQLGDVKDFFIQQDINNIDENKMKQFPKIDLVIFGSPCRSLSKATAGNSKYNQGLQGVSGLFYYCNKILQWIKENNNFNVKFMVENVDSTKKNDLNIMTSLLGAEPILIDSSKFSAQSRLRNYWTNIYINRKELEQTTNNLVLSDILEETVDEKYFYSQDFDYFGESYRVCANLHINGHDILKRVYNKNFKSPTLTSCRGGNLQKKIYDANKNKCRKLTPTEYRRLQTIPDWYKMNVADSHIYNMCGDGWTIEVIKFIFKNLLEDF